MIKQLGLLALLAFSTVSHAEEQAVAIALHGGAGTCLLYTSPSPRD